MQIPNSPIPIGAAVNRPDASATVAGSGSVVERPLIRLTLAATRGNQIKAAAMLGLNRNTLRKKIRDLDIPVVRGLM